MSKPTISLAMIVKNEAPVIERCLTSVLPFISHWVICDTGSTDGTQDIIRAFFARHGIPGQLHERPWQDFAHNRSEALALARPHADYSLIIDADDALAVPAGFQLPDLTDDSYVMDIHDNSIRYQRTQLVRNTLAWRYRGVLHEFVTCDEAKTTGHLPIIMHRNHDGARRRDPNTYRKDAAILAAALETETDPFMRSRYTFYLAQSYRDCGEKEKSLQHYLARGAMGFWQEEVFVALYQAARIKEELGHPDREVIDAYLRAADAQPSRAEGLHGASRICRIKGLNQEGYEIGKRGLDLGLPSGGLFVEHWVYHYGLLDEFAVNAYWSGHYRESLDACLRMLKSPELPADMRPRIIDNAKFAADRLENDNPAKVDRMIWDVRTGAPVIEPASPAVHAGKPDGLVSIITPTFMRGHFLKQALAHVRAQDITNIEWLVMDDSPEPDALLSTIAEPRVRYEHVPSKLSIGEKRNRLVDKARGEFIVHFDDDDYYSPAYVRTMLGNMQGLQCDLVNLRGWYLYDVRSRFFGYWDLMRKHGPHYRCDVDGISLEIIENEKDPFHNNEFGFGFSYAYKRKVWERGPFQDINWNEDGEFSLQARDNFRLGGAHDTTGLCLHHLHKASTSRCFPQHHLPSFEMNRLFPGLPGEPGESANDDKEDDPSGVKGDMPVFVINLDRSVARKEQFWKRNAHVSNLARYPAVDGSKESRESLIARGIMTEDCPYSAGTIGCALSHVQLWQYAVESGRTITIVEDDVVKVADFDDRVRSISASLPHDWDLVMWGYVFDPLHIWIDMGFSKVKLNCFGFDPKELLNGFLTSTHPQHVFRMLNAWGTQAYSITPTGAKRLLETCLPLRKQVVTFSEPGISFYDQGIDGAMNRAYSGMNSFICIPPLAIHDQYGEAPSVRVATDRA